MRTIESVTKRYARELKSRNVTIEWTGTNHVLACTACGQNWYPMVQNGGRYHRGFWVCPNTCNDPKKAAA
jgi:hypothetical protein